MSVMEVLKRDAAVQLEEPAINIPAPSLTFDGLGRTENNAIGFGNLSPPATGKRRGADSYSNRSLTLRTRSRSGIVI